MKKLSLLFSIFILMNFHMNSFGQCPSACDSEPIFCSTPPDPSNGDCTFYYDIDPSDGQAKWFNSGGNVISTPQNFQSNDLICIFVDNSDLTISNFNATIFIGENATYTGNINSLQSSAVINVAGTLNPNTGVQPNDVQFNVCSSGLVNWPNTITANLKLTNFGAFNVGGSINLNSNSEIFNCVNGIIQAIGTSNTVLTLDGDISNCGLMISDGSININSSGNIYNACSFYAKEDMRIDPTVTNEGIFIVEGNLILNNAQLDNRGILKLGSLSTTSNGDAITGSGEVFIEGSSFVQNPTVLFTDQIWCEQSTGGDPSTCQLPSSCGGNADCSNTVAAKTINGLDIDNLLLASTCGEGLSLLPVEMVYFKSTSNKQTISLEWKTFAEKENLGFEVQMSNDNEFKNIGFVKGENKVENIYTFTVENLLNGTYNFRLKQIDSDGSTFYSSIISEYINTKFESTIYPNPAIDKLQISGSDFNRYEISRIDGKLIRNDLISNSEIDVSFLKSGIYLLKMSNSNNFEIRKFIKK